MTAGFRIRAKSQRPWWHDVDRRRPLNEASPLLAGNARICLPLPWLTRTAREYDLTGRSHGTITNGTISGNWDLGSQFGPSVAFDRVNDYVTAPVAGFLAYPITLSTVYAPGTTSQTESAMSLVQNSVFNQILSVGTSGGTTWRIRARNTTDQTVTGGSAGQFRRQMVTMLCKSDTVKELWVDGALVATLTANVPVPTIDTMLTGVFRTNTPGEWAGGNSWLTYAAATAIDPLQLFDAYRNNWVYGAVPLLNRRRTRFISLPATTGGITGTLTTTEDSDTVSALGVVPIVGTLSTTEDSDTVAASAAVLVAGSSTTAEDNDTVSSAGAIAIAGSATTAEDSDAVSASGALPIMGTSNTTEDDDTVFATSESTSTGSSSTTEDPDTVVSVGSVLIVGSVLSTEDSDTVSASGGLVVAGTLTTSEADDTVAAIGAVTISGASSTTDENDGVSASGVLPISGTSVTIEDDDTVVARGRTTASLFKALAFRSPVFRSRFIRSLRI